jgi:hypothetical protein
MKNNTEDTKLKLLQILNSLPQDFALHEVRNYIRAAIIKLESVEEKRIKRNIAHKTRMESPVLLDPKSAIQAIDEEITREKNKLLEASKRKNKGVEEGETDVESLFG